MKLNYIAMMRFEEGRVVSVDIHELDVALYSDELANLDLPHIKSLVEERVKARIEALQAKNKAIPQPRGLHELMGVNPFEVQMIVEVTIEQRKGFFAKWLPYLGGASSIITAASGSVISTIALMLAMKDMESKKAALGISISQAIMSNLFGLVVYFYSQSSVGLERIGAGWDTFFGGQSAADEEPQASRTCGTSSTLWTMKGLLGIATLMNTVSNIASSSQQLGALGMLAHDSSLIPDFIFDLSKIILISSSSISGLSFAIGFLAQLYNDFEKRVLAAAGVEASAGDSGELKVNYVALDMPLELGRTHPVMTSPRRSPLSP